MSHFNLTTFTWYLGWPSAGYLTYLGSSTSMKTGPKIRPCAILNPLKRFNRILFMTWRQKVMTSSAFMHSSEDSTAKEADSMPNILLRIDYEWPLIFLWDIWAIKIQERLLPSSRVTNFTRARVIRSLHYPWGRDYLYSSWRGLRNEPKGSQRRRQ